MASVEIYTALECLNRHSSNIFLMANRFHQVTHAIFGTTLVLCLIVASCLFLATPGLTTNNSSIIITQKGDIVDFAYIGTYDNGTIFDHNTLPAQTIGNNQLLPYFDQNLVNRPAGTQFSFSIPPEQGYTSGSLAGQTLHFQVTITKVLRGGKTIYQTPG